MSSQTLPLPFLVLLLSASCPALPALVFHNGWAAHTAVSSLALYPFISSSGYMKKNTF